MKTLQDRNQNAHVEFLHTQLNLAFTLLQTARIDEKVDPQAVPALLEKIRKSVQTVRAFNAKIRDRTARDGIDARTDELETALSQFMRIDSN
jgi:hypothetical protein